MKTFTCIVRVVNRKGEWAKLAYRVKTEKEEPGEARDEVKNKAEEQALIDCGFAKGRIDSCEWIEESLIKDLK